MKFRIDQGLIKIFPSTLDSAIKRNQSNVRRLCVRIKFDGVARGSVGELRSGHDNRLVSREVAVPVLQILNLVFSQAGNDEAGPAQRVPGEADIITKSVNDAAKQENSRIAIYATVRFACADAVFGNREVFVNRFYGHGSEITVRCHFVYFTPGAPMQKRRSAY